MTEAEEVLIALESQLQRVNEAITAPSLVEAEISALRTRIKTLEAAQKQDVQERLTLKRNRANLFLHIRDAKAKLAVEQENRDALSDLPEFLDTTADAKWRLGLANGDKILAHQLTGARFCARARRAILADDMGLGKTITETAFYDMVGARRILVITPGDVMSGYRDKVKRWSDRSVLIIGRKPKADAFMLLDTIRKVPRCVVIINYEAWRRSNHLINKLISFQFDTVTIDEAHRCKETSTNAYKGVEKIVFGKNTCPDCGSLVHNGVCIECACSVDADMSVVNFNAMTGTPILNKPEEIYSLLHLINPEVFFSKASFRRNYCLQLPSGGWVYKEGGAAQLAKELRSIYLRRTIEDTDVVLPPQELIIHELELDPEEYPLQSRILEMLYKNAQILRENGEAVDIPSVLALITRQRQATVWPGGITIKQKLFGPNGDQLVDPDTGKPIFEIIPVGESYQESVKIDEAAKLVQEFHDSGHRSAVFSQFTEALGEIERRLTAAGLRVAVYTGATSHKNREAIQRNFDREYGEEPKWDAVLVQFKTGGEGLDLTAITQMIILDEEWNGGKNDQAYARISRIGQTSNTAVHVLRVIARYSKDIWMAELISRKRTMVGQFDEATDTYKELLEGMFSDL